MKQENNTKFVCLGVGCKKEKLCGINLMNYEVDARAFLALNGKFVSEIECKDRNFIYFKDKYKYELS